MKRLVFSSVILAAAACGDDAKPVPANAAEALVNYADIAEASYADAHARAQLLATAVDTFTAAPTSLTLAAAQSAWVDARIPYLQSEAFRFYDGPIDDPESGPEGLLNAWPLDEAYIDYVVGMPNAGLVNDPLFAITNDAIEGKNEEGGDDHISTGYHAVEFLLWGQDLSAASAGQRPVSDYVSAENHARRALYLETAADGIVANLATLVAAWDGASTTNYRSEFLAAGPEEGLRRVFTGLVILSANELGGERLVGIETGDQNDEHSCFSDTTRTDFIEDVRGVQNVYLGRYVRTSGTSVTGVSLYDVLAVRNQALADVLRDRIATSLTLAEALMSPYDQEILPGNAAGHARLESLRTSLQTQGDLLEQAMDTLGLPFSPPEE